MVSGIALDALREKIRAIEGAPSVRRRRLSTGVEAFDRAVGGLPAPGILEIIGPVGAGRTRLALALAARITRAERRVAWVDTASRLYPPAAADHGVALDRLWVVRPPMDESAPWAWATEQLLRSGRFPLVVVELPERLGTRRALAHGWARAAEHGGATALVITHRSVREIPADVRVSVGNGALVVLRDRLGPHVAGEHALPPWPAAAAPLGEGA